MADENITGGRELAQFLATLPARMERNIMRAALAAGARVIAKEVRATAPVGPPSSENAANYGGYAGALRDSVRVSTKNGRDGRVTATVKVGGKSKKGADVYYATWVEYGTRPHLIKAKEEDRPINYRLSRKRGEVVRVSIRTLNRNMLRIGNSFVGAQVMHPGARPQPFVRPAFDSKGAAAVEAVAAKIRERLTKQGIDVPAPLPGVE